MPVRSSADLESFRARAEALVSGHPVVTDNRYTAWFATGAATGDDVARLTVQFSVFSHLFLEAQLRKVLNAADIDSYRAGKEILMNELGVVFRPPAAQAGSGRQGTGEVPAAADSLDPEIVGTEGTVDGGRFRFSAAHFEWLLRFAAPLGLSFSELGKRRHGSRSTLFFCDELVRIYGSDDPSVAEGASYGVENWAAAGFWKELIRGLSAFKARECPELPLGFWVWHDRIEDQHAAHTADELAEAFFRHDFDEDRFLAGAAGMLDAVKVFWDGLEADRVAAAERRVA